MKPPRIKLFFCPIILRRLEPFGNIFPRFSLSACWQSVQWQIVKLVGILERAQHESGDYLSPDHTAHCRLHRSKSNLCTSHQRAWFAKTFRRRLVEAVSYIHVKEIYK
jgi:hypothetical protein